MTSKRLNRRSRKNSVKKSRRGRKKSVVRRIVGKSMDRKKRSVGRRSKNMRRRRSVFGMSEEEALKEINELTNQLTELKKLCDKQKPMELRLATVKSILNGIENKKPKVVIGQAIQNQPLIGVKKPNDTTGTIITTSVLPVAQAIAEHRVSVPSECKDAYLKLSQDLKKTFKEELDN